MADQTCAVGPCPDDRVEGSPYCPKHGPNATRQASTGKIYWSNVTHVRFWWAVIIGPLIIGAALSLLWVPLGVLGWIVAVLAIGWTLLRSAPLVCPHCRKRSKMGATACHHCGRDLVATS